jgi:hypothetical protein
MTISDIAPTRAVRQERYVAGIVAASQDRLHVGPGASER